jgi:hypothetical protein
MGTRSPFSYAPSGAAANAFGASPAQALYIGRLVSAAASIALLVVAAWLCWDGSRLSLLGPLLAMSPAVLWVGGLLSSSGPEVAAGVLLAAAAVRLGRDPSAIGLQWWTATGVGAVVLAGGRPFGPFLLAAYFGLFLFEARTTGAKEALRLHPQAALTVGGGVAAAVIANFWWQLHMPGEGVVPTIGALLQGIGPAVISVPQIFIEEIGVFGVDDLLMPPWSYALWGAALILVVGAALLKGERRDIRLLEFALVGSFGVRWAFAEAFGVYTNGWPQGRHMLPITVAVAILAGETLSRNRAAIPRSGRLVAIVGTLALTVQLLAWYAAAHRFAVGQDGDWWLFSGTQWAPPGGWLPAAAVMAVGLGLFGLSVLWPPASDEAQLRVG